MIRKNFFITEAQKKWLDKTSEKSGLPEAELLRRFLDYIMKRKDIEDEIMYRRGQNEDKSKC